MQLLVASPYHVDQDFFPVTFVPNTSSVEYEVFVVDGVYTTTRKA